MKLDELANSFLKTARQLNLWVRPTIKVVSPIPHSLIPRLQELTTAKTSISTMDFALSLVESNDPQAKNYTAILALDNSNIIGWALVRLDPEDPSPQREGDIDIFVDPPFRRYDIGSLLRHEASLYIVANKHTPGAYDHFQPYRERDLDSNTILQQQLAIAHSRLTTMIHTKRNLPNSGLSKKELSKRMKEVNEDIRQIKFTIEDILEKERETSEQPPSNPSQLPLPI